MAPVAAAAAAHTKVAAMLAKLFLVLPPSVQHVSSRIVGVAMQGHHPLLAIAVALLTVAVVYYFVAHYLPGLYMDYYLSKLPGIKGSVPFLGHALLLAGPAPWTKMARWSYKPNKNWPPASQKNGAADGKGQKVCRLVTFNVAGMRVIYLNEPHLLKRVLLTHQRNYRKALDAAYKHFLCLLGTGLVSSEGEHWKRGRLLLSRAMRVDILEDIPAMTVAAVDRIMQKLDHLDAHKMPYLDINEEFRHMTLQVIGQSALSLTPDETDRIFPALYLPIVQECNKRVWAPWRAYMPFLKGSRERNTCLKKLNEVLSDIIRSRWASRNSAANQAKPDVLALCMSQIDHVDSKIVLELRDDVKTMLLAGHETSAALLTWATYETIRHPELRRRIVEEAKVLFDPERCKEKIQTRYGPRGMPTADDVRELVWTPAVLRETLRLHSVVPLVMRLADKPDVWSAADTGLDYDVTIPAGCTIAVGIEGVHKNPEVWPNPELFDPTRFIDAEIANNTNTLTSTKKDVQYSKHIDPYGFLPFINGPRNCLGQHLSLMETQVALSYLFLNWDLQLYCDAETKAQSPDWEKSIGRHHDFIIPQIPHDGLKVCGSPRTN